VQVREIRELVIHVGINDFKNFQSAILQDKKLCYKYQKKLRNTKKNLR